MQERVGEAPSWSLPAGFRLVAGPGPGTFGTVRLGALLEAWLRDPWTTRVLERVDAALGGGLGTQVRAPTAQQLQHARAALARRLLAAADAGRLHVREVLPPRVQLPERPPPPPRPRPEAEQHWIELELLDEEKQPLGGQEYELVLPGGRIRRGTLDGEGRARLTDLPEAGTCRVRFPRLQLEWQPL